MNINWETKTVTFGGLARLLLGGGLLVLFLSFVLHFALSDLVIAVWAFFTGLAVFIGL